MAMPPCANPACANQATKACTRCVLVGYCGKSCQTLHWPVHKIYCNSPLGKRNWRPDWEERWIREKITPAFIGKDPDAGFGRGKYLWGNMPAIDILKLADNEGVGFQGPVNLLFAASGDIRNLVKTVVDLPDGYNGAVNASLNDRDMDVVARNIIILLLLFSNKDSEEETSSPGQVAENIIHVWYSALLPSTCVAALAKVFALIDEVCDKTASKPASAILGKTWSFNHGTHSPSLRVVLTRAQWLDLRKYLVVPPGLTADAAQVIRRQTMVNPKRVDYLQRRLFTISPEYRVPEQRFRDDGILLPFSHSRDGFDTPNPTLFQEDTHVSGWPMKDSSGPTDSYTPAEIRHFPLPLVANDIFGKLHALTKARLERFQSRMRMMPFSISLLCMDVKDLPVHLDPRTMTRIEVSNITDCGYVGTARTLMLLMKYLQPPEINPHAALISLYMNAVEEVAQTMNSLQQSLAGGGGMEDFERLMKYMEGRGLTRETLLGSRAGNYNADILCYINSLSITRDRTALWKKFLEMEETEKMCALLGVSMDRNTIMPAWPYSLKLKPGQPGAQAEFDLLWSAAVSGQERYVEWRFVGEHVKDSSRTWTDMSGY